MKISGRQLSEIHDDIFSVHSLIEQISEDCDITDLRVVLLALNSIQDSILYYIKRTED